MQRSSFSWLHLTDLHYGLKGQDCLWPTLREPFLESLAELRERCGPWDAVIFTGDLVQSGESAQFEAMQDEVLIPLWNKLRELETGDAVLLAVPGNHDLFRPNPLEDNPAVDTLLEPNGYQRIEGKFWDQPAGGYRRAINGAFASYKQWWNQAPFRPSEVKTGAVPGDFSVTLERGGRHIGIVGLNTTFLQLAGGNYQGRLVWDARQLLAVCDGGVDAWSNRHDVCLLLTHQGPDWLTPEAQECGGLEIAPHGRFAIHLFGHQHELQITYLQLGGSDRAVRLCQGCSVFGMEKFGDPPRIQRTHGYTAGRIDFTSSGSRLRLWPRIATSTTGRWRFIPDHVHAELNEKDQGTPAVAVATRPRPAKRQSRALEPILPIHSAPVVRSILLPRRPFFGRKDELEKVARYLRPENRSWGVILDGPGGVGKTALALEAAHRAPVEYFPLKLWFTAKVSELFPEGERQLQSSRVDNFFALLSEIGRALGRDDIPKAVPDIQPQLVRNSLADYRALLVLDNLESFNRTEQLRTFELLDNLPPGCRAIVTSRQGAYSLTAAHSLRLDQLEREAADELLDELGRRWKPVALLDREDRARLYAETGGNPLMLTWVAGQLGRVTGRCRTITEAVERLQVAHRTEKRNEKNDPLDFIFRDLVETLSADETAILSALVHFKWPAPVEWLCSLAQLSSTAAETTLDGLRGRALLIEDEQAHTWLLLPLAARFLRRTCSKEVDESGKRLADQAHDFAVKNGYRQYSRFPELEASWPWLASALPVLIAGDNQRLQEVCNALYRFLDVFGRWDVRLSLSSAAEASAERAGDYMSAGRRAYDVGYGHFLRGQSAEVLTCSDRAARHWKRANAGAHERALAIFLRGQGQRLARDYPAAIPSLGEALGLWRSLEPKSFAVASCVNALAETLRESSHLDEAEVYYRDALEIASHLPDPESVAAYTGNIAELELDRRHWSDAERLAREALKLAEQVRRRELIADDCWRLGKALARQGKYIEGREFAERSVAILTELRSPGLAEATAVFAECSA